MRCTTIYDYIWLQVTYLTSHITHIKISILKDIYSKENMKVIVWTPDLKQTISQHIRKTASPVICTTTIEQLHDNITSISFDSGYDFIILIVRTNTTQSRYSAPFLKCTTSINYLPQKLFYLEGMSIVEIFAYGWVFFILLCISCNFSYYSFILFFT